MEGRKSVRVPAYHRHRTGQARVRIAGRDYYLGKHGTEESREQYRRLIAEWTAAGFPDPWVGPTPTSQPASTDGCTATVSELIVAFLAWAKGYYRKAGTATSEQTNLKHALRPLRRLYGRSPVGDFGPLALKAVRQAMIDQGLCRNEVNKRVSKIRRVFRWGAENEIVPAGVVHALAAVAGLQRGRSEARESRPVEPVPLEHVYPVLPRVSRQIAAMIRLQLLTGMRPGEVVQMRVGDIEVAGEVWSYTPANHKTEHHGKSRKVLLGPQAQAVIRPFLKSDLCAPLFSPREAEAERRARRHRERKTPAKCGNRPGTNRKKAPQRIPGEQYTAQSYGYAISRACAKAKVPHWSPNQLRHTAATRIRSQFGIEMVRVILGHSSAVTSEIYAEIDKAKAARAMKEIG